MTKEQTVKELLEELESSPIKEELFERVGLIDDSFSTLDSLLSTNARKEEELNRAKSNLLGEIKKENEQLGLFGRVGKFLKERFTYKHILEKDRQSLVAELDTYVEGLATATSEYKIILDTSQEAYKTLKGEARQLRRNILELGKEYSSLVDRTQRLSDDIDKIRLELDGVEDINLENRLREALLDREEEFEALSEAKEKCALAASFYDERESKLSSLYLVHWRETLKAGVFTYTKAKLCIANVAEIKSYLVNTIRTLEGKKAIDDYMHRVVKILQDVDLNMNSLTEEFLTENERKLLRERRKELGDLAKYANKRQELSSVRREDICQHAEDLWSRRKGGDYGSREKN
jgi:hypothetical protein